MWLKCMILLYTAYNVAAGGQIKTISRHKDGDAQVLTVCYELGGDITVNEVKHSYLFIGTLEGDIPLEKTFYEYAGDSALEDEKCKYFHAGAVDGIDIIPAAYLGKNVTFLYEATGGTFENPTILSSAKAAFKFPGAFLEDDAVEYTVAVGTTKDSLRIEFKKENTNWGVCKDDGTAIELTCDDTTKNICYAIGIGLDIESYSLCLKDVDNGAIFNTAIFDAINKDLTAGTDPVAVLLTYTIDGATFNVMSTVKTSVKEYVLYNELTKDIYEICPHEDVACTLDPYDKSPKDIQIIITDVDNDAHTASTTHTIKFEDYNIMGTHLGHNVIEMYWVKHTGDDHDFYAAFIAIAAGDTAPLQSVVTDCSGTDPVPPTYCFAYFVGAAVQTTPYYATIAPNLDGDAWAPVLTNQIKSEPITPFPKKDSLVIHVETTATIITDRNTEVDVCFNHVANASTQGTQYEFLAVNSKGTWTKFLGEKKKDESHACFYALELLTADFNENSKFLVLLRDTTNGKVLASGEAELNLQALRAIKPEVDNGNNGSTSTMAIVGAAIAGIACLMALVAAAVMFVMKIKRDNDGLQYPLHRTNIEQDSSYIHGLDNPIPTM